MLQFICVDTYFITDYGVFCGINAHLFKMEQHCGRWNHPTQVSSPKKGEECSDGGDSSALSGQRPFCVVVSSSLWNRRSGFESRSWN